jgi:coenzyme F420-dependent oxidoreductase
MAPTLDLLIGPADHDSVDTMADQAGQAEELGFSYVSMGETTGWNIIPVMAVLADRTEEIGITDDVLSPYSRAPTTLAQAALTLDDIADGRYRLGLGTSSPALAERWHAQAFDRPLRRLRETIDVVREVYSGEAVTYEGEIFEFGGMNYGGDAPDDPPAIDVSAFGPKTVELAGRFGDGWVPQLLTPDGLRDRLEDLRRGADLGDRDPEAIRVAPIVRAFADEDRELAREQARGQVAFLIGAYGPYYGNSVARQGYESIVEDIRDAWEDRDTEAMAARLPDELLDRLAAAGTHNEVRERVDEFAAVDGVDAVRLGFVNGMTLEQKKATMRAVVG